MLRGRVALALALTSGCGTASSVVELNEDLRRIAPSAGASDAQVGPGAVLSIDVEHEPEVPAEHRVLGDGTIQVALCGALDVGGRSLPEITDALEACLQEYIRAPAVQLALVESGPTRVTPTM